jgi:hypothetical protein
MRQTPVPSALQREQAVIALVPFFVDTAAGNSDVAHAAAAEMLDAYQPMTARELQLAAQIVAFGFAALACLGAAATVGARDLDIMLYLQEGAIALNALEAKSTKALDARRRERERAPHLMSEQSTQWDNAAFQTAIGRALEKLLYANARMRTPAPPVTAKPEKLPLLSAEPMTFSVLARLGAEAEAELGFGDISPTRQ